MRRPVLFISAAFVALAVQPSFTQAPSAGRAGAPAAQTNPTQLGNDANGNPLRLATKTGHVSNYDESKVKPYTLPDPLVLADGTRVTTADQWTKERRPEILKLYEDQIYGRVPDNAPTVTWTVADTDPHARNGAAVMSHLVGRMGDKANAPLIHVTLYTPAGVTKPVPVILLVNFGGGTPARGAAPARGRAQQAAGRAGPDVPDARAVPVVAARRSASRRTRPTSSRTAGDMRPSATRTSNRIAPTRGLRASSARRSRPARRSRGLASGAPSAPGPGGRAASSITSPPIARSTRRTSPCSAFRGSARWSCGPPRKTRASRS
jgi:hypothetical protein